MKTIMLMTAVLLSACTTASGSEPRRVGAAIETINCASTASTPRTTRTTKLGTIGGTSIGTGVFQVIQNNLTGNWSPYSDGDILGINIHVHAGECLEMLNASVYGSDNYTVTMSMLAQDDAFHGSQELGAPATSIAENLLQTLIVIPIANDNSGRNETATAEMRSYHLQFTAHQVHASSDSLYVGPITVVTSTAN